MIKLSNSDKRLLRIAKGGYLKSLTTIIAKRNGMSEEEATNEITEYLRPKLEIPSEISSETAHIKGDKVEGEDITKFNPDTKTRRKNK